MKPGRIVVRPGEGRKPREPGFAAFTVSDSGLPESGFPKIPLLLLMFDVFAYRSCEAAYS